MFLSIVIPHYNLERRLLERCITSITTQEIADGDYEIIVVDDGSAQPPLWLETERSTERVRFIQAVQGGPGAARNRGIEEARGKYIMFVDADDYLIGNGDTGKCIDVLKREKPQILRYRYHVVTNPEERLPNAKDNIKFSNTISGATFMANHNLPGSPCLYFFSRELAVRKGIRFPEGCYHEDEEFNTILHFHAQSLITSDACLYCYCRREGSTTANTDRTCEERGMADIFKVIERITNFRGCFQNQCNSIQKQAIDRKLNMLAVDAILNMLHSGASTGEIRKRCLSELAPLSLYPIPAAGYSLKYRIFRILANSNSGIRLLHLFTPGKNPKKK